jgi:poly(hydroxyalkanoate) depolymerase family esterase
MLRALRPRRRARKPTLPPVVAPPPAVPVPPAPLPPPPVVPRPRVRAPARGRWLTEAHAGPAGARPYHVFVPPGLDPATRVPLVVLLHGCRQTALEFAGATRFDDLARRHGFVLACPQQQPADHRQRCWRWYEAAHQRRGAGEPEILAGIARAVVAKPTRWCIDPARVYVAGLSAGGAMALVLGATYPDLFAAVGVHSAPPYGSATSGNDALGAMAGHVPAAMPLRGPDGRGMPPAIVFHGDADRAVRVRAGQRVADQWLAFHAAGNAADGAGPDRIVRHRTSGGSAGRPYTTTRWYAASGRKMLEFWQVQGLGHAWSGGRPGAAYADPRGPRASAAMWSFFAARGLP